MSKKYFGFMEMFSELYCHYEKEMFALTQYPCLMKMCNQVQPEESNRKKIKFSQLTDSELEEFVKYMGLDKQIFDLKNIIKMHENETYTGNAIQELLQKI